jgi:hypothetical protein
MNLTIAFAGCSFVILFLILALAREVRLRRALQRLLIRLLNFWRNPHARDRTPRPNVAPDDPSPHRSGL